MQKVDLNSQVLEKKKGIILKWDAEASVSPTLPPRPLPSPPPPPIAVQLLFMTTNEMNIIDPQSMVTHAENLHHILHFPFFQAYSSIDISISRKRCTIIDSSELISGCRFTHGWNRSTQMRWLSRKMWSIGWLRTLKSGTTCTLGIRATTWCTTSRNVMSKSWSARKNR